MKSFWTILLVILIIAGFGVGGYFGYQYLFKKDQFQWGVTMRPHAIGNYTEKNWAKQLNLAKTLGVNSARITWQHDGWYKGKTNPFGFYDELVKTLKANNINMLLVVEPDPKKQITDFYQDAFDNGKAIASHYKGKIKYYQLMNEGGAQSLKNPTDNGQSESQYDEKEYAIVKDYMRGLSDGISSVDSKAIKIVTVSYTHTGFLDKITKDGIKFDWIGVDWYNWMGPIQDKTMEDGSSFVEKLKSYNKPLTFMEVNAVTDVNKATGEKVVNEDNQADFISKTAEWAWENRKFVKGFYVLELVDNANNNASNAENFGIVAATKVKSKITLGDPRKAYLVYQAIIKKYSGK